MHFVAQHLDAVRPDTWRDDTWRDFLRENQFAREHLQITFFYTPIDYFNKDFNSRNYEDWIYNNTILTPYDSVFENTTHLSILGRPLRYFYNQKMMLDLILSTQFVNTDANYTWNITSCKESLYLITQFNKYINAQNFILLCDQIYSTQICSFYDDVVYLYNLFIVIRKN